MTSQQAKKDAALRLWQARIPYQSLRAKSVSFEGLGYGMGIFVYIKGIDFQAIAPERLDAIRADIPKPSLGGYILKTES